MTIFRVPGRVLLDTEQVDGLVYQKQSVLSWPNSLSFSHYHVKPLPVGQQAECTGQAQEPSSATSSICIP
jgi:hypothetical protein